MSKATDDYVAASRALGDAEGQVEAILVIITAAATHLSAGQWKSRVIGGVGGFSTDMAGARDLDIREHQWPTLQQLRGAMQTWQRLRVDEENAWNRLSADEQRVMTRRR